MGKSQRPLKIAVEPALQDWPEWEQLRTQGHAIILIGEYGVEGTDLIIGPHCWRMDEEHHSYLNLAIRNAQKRRYPKPVKETSDD